MTKHRSNRETMRCDCCLACCYTAGLEDGENGERSRVHDFQYKGTYLQGYQHGKTKKEVKDELN